MTYRYALKTLLLLLTLFIGPAVGQQLLIETTRPPDATQTTKTIRNFGVWSLTCSTVAAAKSGKNRKRCLMSQSYYMPGSEQLLFEVSGELVRGAKAKFSSLVLVFRVPLGLLLKKGIAIRVDKRQQLRLAVRSCHVAGCLVPLSLRGKLLRMFTRGRKLSLTFYGLDGKPVTYTMPLEGFAKSYTVLKKEALVRHKKEN